jgi:aspartate carbamoyltransferase catalytic subunit
LLEVSEIASHHPLDGKLVITAFFEASTRTRLSFESAVLRLAGRVLSVPDGKVTGAAKGESLADIGEMFNSYGDLVVLRHPRTEALAEVRSSLLIPLVNAGNGSGEHPTQALVDWYALLKWRPSLALEETPADEKIHLGIIGTPGSMRAVKSFMFLALEFGAAIRKITLVSEMADPLGGDLSAAVQRSAVPVEIRHDVSDVLRDLDVIYMNSITLIGDSYQQLDSRYRIDAETPLRSGAVVLHPLARRAELDTSLDATQHNLYFAQAAGAVYMRQALLVCMLDRIRALPQSVLYLAS